MRAFWILFLLVGSVSSIAAKADPPAAGNPAHRAWKRDAKEKTASEKDPTSYFHSCDDVIAQPRFKILGRYYDSHPDLPLPDSCCRLNDRQFLVTVTLGGRVEQGLYFVDTGTGEYGIPDGSYTYGIKVDREVLGKGKKRFVVLRNVGYHGGSGYQLLFLKPGSGKASFAVRNLFFDWEDMEDGLCGRQTTEKAAHAGSYTVLDEGTERARLVFSVDEQDCVTRKVQRLKRCYGLDADIKELPSGACG